VIEPKLQLRALPPVIVQLGLAGLIDQVNPDGNVSLTVTLVAVMPDAALVAVIVKLAALPALIGEAFATFVIDTSVVETVLNVTVSVGLEPNTALHGFVVPVQLEELRLFGALQPAKVDPPLAVATKVTVAPLSEVVILGEHVLLTVWEAAFVPVPPHETGAFTVPVLGVTVTVPLPVPANFRSKFRASVNVVWAVNPEVNPRAPTRNFIFRS